MRYVTCGETTVSALGFGCASVMGRVGRRDSLRAMEMAWDAGVTLFDTARSYGYGEAEGLLGEFLRGRRARAVVVTKFGILPAPSRVWKQWVKPAVRQVLHLAPGLRGRVRRQVAGEMSAGHFDVATLRVSLESSLRALRTDYVDGLLAHEAPESLMQQEDLIAELAMLVSAGKIRRAGISSTAQAVVTLARRGPRVLSILQFPAWSADDRSSEAWSPDDTSSEAEPEGAPQPRLRMVNHPLGGAGRVGRIALQLAGLARSPDVDAVLREKLAGDSSQRVAEFCFARARQSFQPHVIVPSMLQRAHLRANIAAIASSRFTVDDLRRIERSLALPPKTPHNPVGQP